MQPRQNGIAADGESREENRFLDAHSLLAGSAMIHDVAIPADVLIPIPTSGPARMPEGRVRMRPLRLSSLALISQASRENPSLVPLLMIKESLVEPALHVDQIRQMHPGLAHFLIGRINRISGLDGDEDAREASASTLGQAHLLLARHFGWTPAQVAELTPGQVAVYLAGIEKLLELDTAKAAAV